MNQPKSLQIETLWQNYLQLAGVVEEKLPEIQRQEMKRAFMGGISQIIVVMRDDLALYPEEVAVKLLDNIWQDVGKFWNNESEKQKGNLN